MTPWVKAECEWIWAQHWTGFKLPLLPKLCCNPSPPELWASLQRGGDFVATDATFPEDEPLPNVRVLPPEDAASTLPVVPRHAGQSGKTRGVPFPVQHAKGWKITHLIEATGSCRQVQPQRHFQKLPRHETPNSDRRRSHAAEYCAGCAAKRRLLSGSCNIILRYLRAHSQTQGHGLEQTRARECSRHVSKPAPWSCVRVFVRVCVCVCVRVCVCVCKHHYKRQDLCVCFTRVPELVS